MSQTPYKHRLAHDPGRRSRSGRAFRCVGVLGQRPKRVLVPFTRVKGTPRRRAVQIIITKNLTPPSGDIPLLPNGSRGLGRGTDMFRGSIPPKASATLPPYRLILAISRSTRRARAGRVCRVGSRSVRASAASLAFCSRRLSAARSAIFISGRPC